jgi:hypothetical protein
LKDLQLNTTKPTEESFHKCEIYAKMVLLMFYPFRCLNSKSVIHLARGGVSFPMSSPFFIYLCLHEKI